MAFKAQLTGKIMFGIVVGVILFLFPKIASQHFSLVMLGFFASAIAVLGFNLLFGYTGLLSIGHSLFFAVGAYTVAFSMRSSIFSMELILLITLLVSGLIAALVGAICVRYTDIHFSILTFAFAMLLYSFIVKFYYVTGGDDGLRVLMPHLLGFNHSAVPKMQFLMETYYYYALIVACLATWAMWRIVTSYFGLSLKAIRDNPVKAEYLGINISRYRWFAFIISGMYTALGGALLVPVIGHVDPTLSHWFQSGQFILMTVLGGFTYFLGPILGSLVFTYLQDTLMSVFQYWRFFFGALLAFVVIVAPGGIMGGIDSLQKKKKGGV
ncbi:MAG: branched-chain amino acid ABC transporter permease [Thermodesulfobacteriota bacterium]|jgi:branched-chain amino acid transport system permease protein